MDLESVPVEDALAALFSACAWERADSCDLQRGRVAVWQQGDSRVQPHKWTGPHLPSPPAGSGGAEIYV